MGSNYFRVFKMATMGAVLVNSENLFMASRRANP